MLILMVKVILWSFGYTWIIKMYILSILKYRKILEKNNLGKKILIQKTIINKTEHFIRSNYETIYMSI